MSERSEAAGGGDSWLWRTHFAEALPEEADSEGEGEGVVIPAARDQEISSRAGDSPGTPSRP